jgi:AcrR family transcriptional regulator
MVTLNRNQVTRSKVLEAAVDTICERGLIDTRVADIGRRAGMSPGHVMYYFATREEIVIQALRLVNDRFFAAAMGEVEALPTARERLLRLIELGMPSPPQEQPHSQWLLWLDVWARSPRSPVVDADRSRLERRWIDAYAAIVEQGQAAGEFRDVDADDLAVRLAALIDGLGKSLVLRDQWMTRERALDICRRVVSADLGGGSGRLVASDTAASHRRGGAP